MRVAVFAFIVLCCACTHSKKKPDISGIHVNSTIQRFDRDFFSMDTTKMEASLEALYKKYPSFLPLYFEFLSPVSYIARQEHKSYKEAVLEYFRNIKSLSDSVQLKYKDLSGVEKELDQGLRYAKYYYPSYKVPALFSSVESLNPENPQEIYGTTYYGDTLIISLQMYLGKDFPAYDPSQYFDYLRRRFDEPYIAANCMRSVAGRLYADSSQDLSLIEQFVEKGKQWYLLDHLLPDAPDSVKTLISDQQLKWCASNEGNIWAAVIGNNPDLYTVDKERIQTYIGEGPFTQDMPHETSPGNIGQWIGWRIVQQYAGKNPDKDLKAILATPARALFQQSGYRPK